MLNLSGDLSVKEMGEITEQLELLGAEIENFKYNSSENTIKIDLSFNTDESKKVLELIEFINENGRSMDKLDKMKNHLMSIYDGIVDDIPKAMLILGSAMITGSLVSMSMAPSDVFPLVSVITFMMGLAPFTFGAAGKIGSKIFGWD